MMDNEIFNEELKNYIDVQINEKVNNKVTSILDIISKQTEDLKTQIEITSNQTIVAYELHKNIEEHKKEMVMFQGKMNTFSEKMDKLEDKIDNYIFLSPPEMAYVSDLVREKAIKISDHLNYINFYPNAKDFGDIVKRVMIGLRSMLRAKFKVPRWYMIKHVDYDASMEYLSLLDTKDFLDYRNSRDVNKNKKSKLKLVK